MVKRRDGSAGYPIKVNLSNPNLSQTGILSWLNAITLQLSNPHVSGRIVALVESICSVLSQPNENLPVHNLLLSSKAYKGK